VWLARLCALVLGVAMFVAPAIVSAQPPVAARPTAKTAQANARGPSTKRAIRSASKPTAVATRTVKQSVAAGSVERVDSQATQKSDSAAELSLAAVRATAMRAAPDAGTQLSIPLGMTMTPLMRDRGWVRVRVEGWVPEKDVVPAQFVEQPLRSTSELRADPDGSRGRIVHWDVEVLALQTADPLRRELGRDESYLLVRGPRGEQGLLYVVVPPSMLQSAKILPPLAAVTVTARVRTARSQPVGVPVLELISLTRR
jgi:hypothetical protein